MLVNSTHPTQEFGFLKQFMTSSKDYDLSLCYDSQILHWPCSMIYEFNLSRFDMFYLVMHYHILNLHASCLYLCISPIFSTFRVLMHISLMPILSHIIGSEFWRSSIRLWVVDWSVFESSWFEGMATLSVLCSSSHLSFQTILWARACPSHTYH